MTRFFRQFATAFFATLIAGATFENLPAIAQVPPFSAYSVSTLGGNCSATGSLLYQDTGGVSKCLAAGTPGQVVKLDVTNLPYWATVSGTGTVTSVGLALPSEFSVSGSPVTATGTLTGTWANAAANSIFAGPDGVSGAPAFRALVDADLPVVSVSNGGTAVSSASGTALDNITGFSGTGILRRTGAGTYTQGATVSVAEGGTNVTSASGTALDNITGFSGTGLMRRMGAGTYTFGTTVSNAEMAANSVDTTQLVDASVTTAKLATPAASGASMVLLGSATLSGGYVSLTGYMSSTYDTYRVIGNGFYSSGGSVIACQFGTGGTYSSAGNYFDTAITNYSDGTSANVGHELAANFIISDTVSVSVDLAKTFDLIISRASGSRPSLRFQTSGPLVGGTHIENTTGSGVYQSVYTPTDFRCFSNASTLTGGDMWIYGIRKN